MTDRYRVLALDQPGHGETDWAEADRYGIDDMADDLEAFVRALGLQGFTLLGRSMGGMVAMDYAGRRPKPLAACVIVDIGPEIVQSGSGRIRPVCRQSIFLQAVTKHLRRLAPPIPDRQRSFIGIVLPPA